MNQKTKKIILLITTIITLLINIGYIYAISTGILIVESSEISAPVSNTAQIVILCICAFTNLVSIPIILKNLITHKKKLIVLNIIQLLLGSIFNIFFAIINIIILATKTKDVEEFKEKKELPILEDLTKYKWYIYFIIFTFLFIICYTPFINLLPIPKTKISSILTIIILYILQIIGLVIPMFNELKRDFIIFKNNFKLYLSKMLPRFGIISILYLICSLFLSFFVQEIAQNQANINNLPIYITIILGVILAPILEELMFRGFINKFVKNKILFLLLSSLIFGGMHVTYTEGLQQILYILPYSILGFAFAQNYLKTRNIVSNIFLHSTWNSIALLAMILIKFL